MVVVAVIFGIPVAFALGAIIFASRSARRRRQGHMNTPPLIWGAVATIVGMAVLALIAWSTREDIHYDDARTAMSVLGGIYSGSLLIFGLGPFIPWLLGILRRNAARLPRAFRPAAHHVGRPSDRTAAGVATTMVAIAAATALLIVSPAVTSDERASYYPDAQPGALVVAGFSAEQAATVRATIQQELPGGVPLVENNALSHRKVEGGLVGDMGSIEAVHAPRRTIDSFSHPEPAAADDGQRARRSTRSGSSREGRQSMMSPVQKSTSGSPAASSIRSHKASSGFRRR